jgi:hypothetical protein
MAICLVLHAGAADRSQHCTWDDSIHRADPPSKLRAGSGWLTEKLHYLPIVVAAVAAAALERGKKTYIMIMYGGNESQALAEEPPVYPHKFFRTLLDLAFARAK